MEIARTAARCLTGWLLLAVSGVHCAESEFPITRAQYLVVASVQDPEVAQTMLARAQRTIGGNWGLTSYEDDRGLWQRVVSGPFLTDRLARSALEDAQLADFDSAWLLTGTAVEPLLDGTADPSFATEYPDYDGLPPSSAFEPAAGGRGRSWSTRRIPERRSLNTGSNYIPPVLIQTAPLDYRLNRLERDGEALAPD